MKKIALLYGGQSPEHDISLISASSVLAKLLEGGHEVLPIALSREGPWYLGNIETQKKLAKTAKPLSVEPHEKIHIAPGEGLFAQGKLLEVECAMPIVHGVRAEDGTVQAMLESAAVPYTSADPASSAIAMDKATAKVILRDADIPTLPFLTIHPVDLSSNIARDATAQRVLSTFPLPLFVKPACGGSSQNTTKVKERPQLLPALYEALKFSHKAIIEPALQVREIEVAVIGNEEATAFAPAEIITSHEFYDYDAKYLDTESTEFFVPANIREELVSKIKDYAIRTYKAIGCTVMARVDFFVTDEQIYVNEINTIPGFTDISMFPRMVSHDGISYVQMLDKLIHLAKERHSL